LPKRKKRKASPSPSISTVSSFTGDEDFDSDLEGSHLGDDGDADGLEGDEYSSDESSGSEDENSLNGSDEDDKELNDSEGSEDLNERQRARKKAKAASQSVDDLEGTYEIRRKLQASASSKGKAKAEQDEGVQEVSHLPIKLANGEIQMLPGTTTIEIPKELRKASPTPSLSDDDMSGTDSDDVDEEDQVEKLSKQKGRFGRMSVLDVVTYEDPSLRGMKRKGVGKLRIQQRLAIAKEQIAKTGAEIMAGGELIDNVSAVRY
jgi:nucleolar complex protein 3